MGLLLSVLVVCVGVLEAISCVRHVQHGYLPYWLPSRMMRPMCHEAVRRKPNEDDSSDESSDELSRILQNGGGVHSKESPSYGLTPILTEHRRKTPILCDADDEDDPGDVIARHPKYVENNVDDCCCTESNHVGLLNDGFRPISPSEEAEPEAPIDESYVSSTGKFLEVPPDGSSPLQRSSSEETLHDSEGHSPRAVEEIACNVDESAAPSSDVDLGTVEGQQDVVFKLDEASPVVDVYEQEFTYPESQFSQTMHLDEEGNNVTDIPEEDDEDLCLTNDPVFNLVSAAAYILRNEAEYERSDLLPRKSEQQAFGGTTSSCRPLSLDVATARIPTPQAHRESMPFDLMAAHASTAARESTRSSDSRPDTPRRSNNVDISWPVFHPEEPVIKRPTLVMDRGDSIDEVLDPEEKAPIHSPDNSHSTDLRPLEAHDRTVPEDSSYITSSSSLVQSVPADASSDVPVPSIAVADEKVVEKVDVPLATREPDAVEDYCSRTVVKGTASAPVTPYVTVPGAGRVVGAHKSIFDIDNEDLPKPPPVSTVDRFGRITSRPQKWDRRRQRRGSLERPTSATAGSATVPDAGGTPLKDSVMSKSLPDFFFEENAAALAKAQSVPTPPVDPAEDDVRRANDEVPETEPVGKDITRKESSIKRRRGYRKKERSTWTPSRAKNRVGAETALSSTESFGETDEESKGGSVDEPTSAENILESEVISDSARTPVDSTVHDRTTTAVSTVESEVVSKSVRTPVESTVQSSATTTVSKVKSEAILNSALTPLEVLHHGEVKPESAVFATTTQQPKKRLLKPAKAASFEEAPPPPMTQPPPPHPPQQPPQTQSRAPAKTVAPEPPKTAAPPLVAARDVTGSARAPAPKPDETTANIDDEKEEEDEEEDASESEAMNIKLPQQSSEPAPFWLIFSGEYTKAMSKDWHSGHFCCWQCDESLTGQRYVLRDDHPYCIKCYESVFANMCEECSKTIGIDSKDLSYKDKHWHEACFLCNKCRVSLVDKQFGSKADKIYCSNCYDAQFASRCDGCGEIFRAGTKKMEYKTRQWHEKCFCCCVCKSAIGTKSFIPREQEIYCATCYEEKFATRCVKCNKIITSGGVTYKNEPWHRECFTCTHCNTSLAGQRFTSRDEKPYCAECFGELFAKRCTACSKPITGIGGTRFISFEDRHWHNDCFICASCRTSLVGRGFITDADDIICPECAKQKLM